MSAESNKSSEGSASGAGALSARLSAVQALYQMTQNKKPIRAVVAEYLEHRSDMEIDGEKLVKPDGALLKAILFGVDERKKELEAFIEANTAKSGTDRDIEPLLKAILLCGCFELLAHQDTDFPIIINDYINVTHAFYDKQEAGLVNAVLDAISRVLRS